jgi:O-antigen/teichoic acid export membrane protein/2-polyprenyl-3-methyl-5-hydroxy-6-metoxy-1,4-benzoquinol methylase
MNEEQKGLTLLPDGRSGSGQSKEVRALAEDFTPSGPPLVVLDVDERVRLMFDGVFNSSSILVSGLIGFFLVPIMLRGLGVESYGIWIAALSLVGIIGLFDFGLGLTVIREVAASLNQASRSETAKFVKAARNAFFLVGVFGAVLIATLGLPLSHGLRLSAASQRMAPAVFVLAGVALLADRLLASTTSVLSGLRRFDLRNSLAIFAALGRAIGLIVLLKLGTSLLGLMIWQVAATGASVWAGQAMIGRLAPEFRTSLGWLDWKLVRAHLPFGLANQIATFAEVILWQMVPVIVGLVLGSGWIAVFYIAQKFPTSIAPFIWATASALFPAVSQHQNEQGIAHTREILEVGTRWTMVLALPLSLALLITAPELLQAWVGEVRPGPVLVLRLITVAVFMEGMGAASYQMLWGRGEIRNLVIVSSCLAVSSLGLSLILLHRMGISGAGWGLLVPMLLASVAYIMIASRICQVSVGHLVHMTFDGLFLPVIAFLVIGGVIIHWSAPGWIGVIASSVGGGCGYLAGFCLVGARVEEEAFVQKMLTAPLTMGRTAYRSLRHLLARVGFLRSGYFLILAIQEALLDSPARGQAELNHEFEPREDPWDYATVSYQRDRIRSEVEMLDAVHGAAPFGNALEVGCAEGLFTEVLVPRCESLLAADISPVALSRARRRLQEHQNVHFAQWDLRVDPVPDTYDLIVIIHALEYIRNPLYVRRARTKLVNSLRPGGYLLVGTMKVAEIYENAWWGRYFLRSGKKINNFFARHPALKLVRTAEFYLGKDYVAYDVLLQKTS